MKNSAIVGAACALATAWPLPAAAQETTLIEATEAPPALGGFVDLSGSYDTRNLTTGAVAVFLTLPAGFQYFGFVNMINQRAEADAEQSTYFSQQHLYYGPLAILPVDLAAHAELMTGNDNDAVRAGLRWRVSDTGFMRRAFEKARLFLSVAYYPVQYDHIQASGWRSFSTHAYNWQIWPGRIYLGGFLDHYMSLSNGQMSTLTHDFVTEHQVGVRVVAGLHVITEFLHNDFAPRKNGIGFGLEYLVNFSYEP